MADINSTPKQLSFNLEFHGRVYLIRNSVNGKVYIGQTVQELDYRWRQHRYDALTRGFKYPLHSAMRKYGVGVFSIEELAFADSQNELNRLEEHFVRLHRSIERTHGYNVRYGGDSGGKLSQGTREKLRALMIGKEAHNKGKPMPEHQRLAMMERFRTQGHPAVGRICSEYTKQKIGEAARASNTGRKASEETRRRMSETQKARMDSMTPEQKARSQAHRKGVPRSAEICAKLSAGQDTPERVARRKAIIALRLTGAAWSSVASAFGVTRTTVQEIFARYYPVYGR